MQPRALGRKASDEFTVPLCRGHHRAVHQKGNEQAWWVSVGIDPSLAARKLWEHTQVGEGKREATGETVSKKPRSRKAADNKSAGPQSTGSEMLSP
jgi:hypothetical protein